MAADQIERTHSGTLDLVLQSTIEIIRAVGVVAGSSALYVTDRVLPEAHGVGEGNSPLDAFTTEASDEDLGYAA